MSVVIKREKINNKFFIVARDNKKIIAKKKVTKGFTVNKAKSIFKRNNTFDANIERIDLKTKPYDEFVDTSPSPSRPRTRPFRYFIIGLLKDGRTIGASSRTERWDSILEAKKEAEKRFFEMLAFSIKDVYDEDEGKKLVKEVLSIKQGIKYND